MKKRSLSFDPKRVSKEALKRSEILDDSAKKGLDKLRQAFALADQDGKPLPYPRPLRISVALNSVAPYLAGAAEVALWREDANGWVKAHRAVQYWTWASRGLLRSQTGPVLNRHLVANVLLLATLRDDKDSGIILTEALLRNPESNSKVFQLPGTPFTAFAIALSSLRFSISAKGFSTGANDQDPYQKLWDCWDKTDDLTPVLAGICDYHIDRSTHGKNANAVGLEFFYWFLAPLPIEVLAIQRVRAKKKLPPVTLPKHPLLETPLAAFPEKLPEFSDPILDEAVALLKQDLGDL